MVNSSTIVLPAWQRLLEELHKPNHIMPHDVTTCWNSTYDMLEFNLWHVEFCTWILQGYWLFDSEQAEWAPSTWVKWAGMVNCKAIVRHPWGVWAVINHWWICHHRLLRFWKTQLCSSHIPHQILLLLYLPWTTSMTSSLLIPMTEHFPEPLLKVSLQIGKNMLNWYYSLMDSSEVYCIAMGMF